MALHACRVHAGVVERGEVQPVVLASMALSNDTHFVIAKGARGIDRPADLAGIDHFIHMRSDSLDDARRAHAVTGVKP